MRNRRRRTEPSLNASVPSPASTIEPPRDEPPRTAVSGWWSVLGPGVITGASDDDPSGIATYAQAGAAFGLTTLWTAFFTLPLMCAVQFMCAKIGMVSGDGLARVLRD